MQSKPSVIPGTSVKDSIPADDRSSAEEEGGRDGGGGVAKKSKKKEDSILRRIMLRLQDNRYQSDNQESIRKLRELNRLENDSNILLKKVLNVVFVTTGVALLLSVITVIIYTSIVSKPNTKNDHDTSGFDGSRLSNEADRRASFESHVNVHTPRPRDQVVISYNDIDEKNEPRDRSPPIAAGVREGRPKSRNDGVRSTVVTTCRVVPIQKDGLITMGKMCYDIVDGRKIEVSET